GTVVRHNESWTDIREKGQAGTLLASECLYRNRVRVKYPLEEARLSRD
ncbi:vancomycin resistance protein, partial [Pseudomonas aeruginosa]